MRRSFPLRTRPDFVVTLLTQGRLADVLLLQHFGTESVTDTTGPVTGDSGKAVDANNNNTVNKPLGGSTPPASTGAAVVVPSRRAALHERCNAARVAAMQSVCPGSWFPRDRDAAGEWRCALPNSWDSVRASPTSGGGPHRKALLHGSFTTVTDGNQPTVGTIRLLAAQEGATSGGAPLLLSLPLDPAAGGVEIGHAVGGVCNVTVRGAEAMVVADTPAAADAFTAEQNLLAAAACSGLIGRLLEVCSLHATHTTRYDALLIRNPSVQKSLALMACARYGVDAMMSFVMGRSDKEALQSQHVTQPAEAPLNGGDGDLQLPVVESVVLGTYASQALAVALQLTREMLGSAARLDSLIDVPHLSKNERLIPYAYAQQMLCNEPHVLASLAVGDSAQHRRYIAPLLSCAAANGVPAAPMGTEGVASSLFMWAMNAPPTSLRLVAPHVYLRLSANELEGDVATFLKHLREKGLRNDPAFVRTAAVYTAEVFSSVAVLYRATAALTRTGNNAPRDWLLAQTFCSESAGLRAAALREFDAGKDARAVLRRNGGVCDTAHPVELMNAAPVKKKAPAAPRTTPAVGGAK
uniref:Uncharacterized protein n=1 Tax=Trypanosoma congolense (strain IL3000) TaxID=1068625 RepID=G0URD3_TRYCI|nr:conserved hypothetical protein [Trypanosoma congolense IL3000]